MSETEAQLRRDLDREERRAAMFQRLYEVTSALSAAALPEEVVSVMFAQGLQVLRADGGYFGVVSEGGEELQVQRMSVETGEVTDQLVVPLDAPLPIVATARDGEMRCIGSNAELREQHPGLQRIDPDDHACATVPIRSNGRLWGALNVAYDVARPITDVERVLLDLLGEHLSEALSRAERLHDAEQRIRAMRAIEIHDDVVQDLVVARMALDVGMVEEARTALTNGLESAKRIVSEIADEAPDYRRLARGDASPG